MSQVFTLSLRKVNEITKGDIGLDLYPVFDGAPEGFRAALNDKILKHYYTREIGFETIELWRYNVRRHMGEVMPMFNQFYKSQLIAIDPLAGMSVTNESETESEQTTTGRSESSSSGSNSGKSRAVASEFPQTMLNGSEDYATSASDTASNSNNEAQGRDSQTGTARGADSGRTTTKGYTMPESELLMRYRQTFLNVDLEVIESLNQFFMFVNSTGDSYSY